MGEPSKTYLAAVQSMREYAQVDIATRGNATVRHKHTTWDREPAFWNHADYVKQTIAIYNECTDMAEHKEESTYWNLKAGVPFAQYATLDADALAAVRLYTENKMGYCYAQTNELLRDFRNGKIDSNDKTLKLYLPYVRLLNESLQKFPNTKYNVLYRGITQPLEKVESGM